MADYYVVRFYTDCEECGKRFQGWFWAMVPKDYGSPLSSVMSSAMKDAAEYVDARNTKKGLEKRLRDKQWSQLSSNGIGRGVVYPTAHEHRCPHCGARQSWDVMDEPKEPTKTSGILGNLAYVGCGVFLLGIIGLFAGLFIMAFTFNDMALYVCTTLGLILGLIAGVSLGRSINKDDIDSYEDRLAAWRRDKQAYDEFQQALAKRTVHNEPVPEFDTGCFASDIP